MAAIYLPEDNCPVYEASFEWYGCVDLINVAVMGFLMGSDLPFKNVSLYSTA